MFDYILFDLDGTLTDPKEGITKSVQFALHHLGILEPELEKLEPFIGPPLKDSFIEFYGLDQKKTLLAIEKYRERFAKIGIYENKLYPGIDDMLKNLKAAGKKLAVASSKPTVFVEKILQYFKIDQYFDVIMGSELDGTRSKKEEVVKEVLESLFQKEPFDQQKVVMVGDRKFDIEGAKEFGLFSIGVTYGYAIGNELEEAGADYVVTSVKRLEKLLLSHKNKKSEPRKAVVSPTNEPSDKKNLITSLFQVLYPFLMYFFIYQIATIALMVIFEKAAKYTGNTQLLETYTLQLSPIISGAGMLISSLFLVSAYLGEMKSGYFPLSEKKIDSFKRFWYLEVQSQRKQILYYIPLVGLSISGAYFINILFTLLKLGTYSAGFQEASRQQSSIPLWLALILYGIVSPFAEELVFRGVIYNRLKKFFPKITAAVVGALLFGIYHGNLVQGIYGFLAGLAIIFSYEIYDSYVAPVLFHSLSNIAVVFALYFSSYTESWSSPENCGLFGMIALVCVTIMRKMKR